MSKLTACKNCASRLEKEGVFVYCPECKHIKSCNVKKPNNEDITSVCTRCGFLWSGDSTECQICMDETIAAYKQETDEAFAILCDDNAPNIKSIDAYQEYSYNKLFTPKQLANLYNLFTVNGIYIQVKFDEYDNIKSISATEYKDEQS